MKKFIFNFQEFLNEKLDISSMYELDDKFDNEITDREYWEFEIEYSKKNFNKEDQLELNKYFGVWKPKFETFFPFKKKYGSFGTPQTILKGDVKKYRHYRNYDDIFYIIDMVMKTKINYDEGSKKFILKFNTIDDVIEFFKEF